MTGQPIFNSSEQAVSVLWHSFARLCGLVVWLFIGFLHLLLALGIALLMWWHQVTPEAVTAYVLQLTQSATVSVLGAAGLSGATLLGLWALLMRRVHAACGSRLLTLLLPEPAGR